MSSAQDGRTGAIRHVAVVIPAADEQHRIADCLRSVLGAAQALRDSSRTHSPAGEPIGVQIIVVLDACTDDTGAVAARFHGVRIVHSAARCVGAARAAGVRAALSAAGLPLSNVWTAHTDADSRVPQDWLLKMVRAADSGVDLVLGTVRPTPELGGAARLRWKERHHDHDGHPHVHGANLGIRADALCAIGGWRALSVGEDADLAQRAGAQGLCILRTADNRVDTSARLEGRVVGGYADYLRALVDVADEESA